MKLFDEVQVVDDHVVGVTEEGDVYVAIIGDISNEWELVAFPKQVMATNTDVL